MIVFSVMLFYQTVSTDDERYISIKTDKFLHIF